MNERVNLTIHTETFEGPLDLLLYLISSHELDISRVSLQKITNQYLQYVQLMQEFDFDIAAEFLVLAATLVYWKSKALLPEIPSEEPPEETLPDIVGQLKEHQKFLLAGETLGQRPMLGIDTFSRINKKPPLHRVWGDMDITALACAYQEMLEFSRKRTQILRKETVSIADTITFFAQHVAINLLHPFEKLHADSLSAIVATFLTCLELCRLKKAHIYQDVAYGPIMFEILESLEHFDISSAETFAELEKVING